MVRRWWWPPFPPWNGAANTARARRPKRQRSTNCTTFGRAHRAMRVEIAEGSPPTDVSERVGGAKSHRRPGADHVGPGTPAWRNRVRLRFHGLVDPKARLVNFVEIT